VAIVGAATGRPGCGELDQAGPEVQRAETGDRAADVFAARPPVDGWNSLEKSVPVPERGPRNDDEEEPDLEKVRREEQTAEQISLRCPFGRA
jgi:hypothetical protein